jgi:hypothetical protein
LKAPSATFNTASRSPGRAKRTTICPAPDDLTGIGADSRYDTIIIRLQIGITQIPLTIEPQPI